MSETLDKLRGNLFSPEDASGLVSSVDTAGFWVDHTEPLKAPGMDSRADGLVSGRTT